MEEGVMLRTRILKGANRFWRDGTKSLTADLGTYIGCECRKYVTYGSEWSTFCHHNNCRLEILGFQYGPVTRWPSVQDKSPGSHHSKESGRQIKSQENSDLYLSLYRNSAPTVCLTWSAHQPKVISASFRTF